MLFFHFLVQIHHLNAQVRMLHLARGKQLVGDALSRLDGNGKGPVPAHWL